MRRLAFLFVLFGSVALHAQLYVSNNSYMYNKGNVVFVTGNVELNGANSMLYLRNQGQLLQGTTGSSANKGTGKLSVFQEGTVNNFAYNYWCSPIGTASALTGNEDFGITMLHVPLTLTSSSPASLITDDSDGISGTGTLAISTYWIWKFLSSTTYSQWFQSGGSTNISAGQGFTMKGTAGTDLTNVSEVAVNNPGSAQRYDFRGKPNDGTISVNVATNSYTLTGNPYPSAMHVNAFLLDASNTACTGIAYYWEQDKTVNSHMLLSYQGGYGTYSPVSLLSNGIYVPATFNTYNIDGTLNTTGATSGLVIERKYAPIGQGFMVKGSANGTLSLKNAHRVYIKEGNFSQFEKQGPPVTSSSASTTDSVQDPTMGIEPISQIRLNTTLNDHYTSQVALAFLPLATDGVDRGIDAKSPVDEVPNEVYFVLDQDRYVIQGMKFDVDKRIPIGVKSTDNATFSFDASTIVNFDINQPIYIYDGLDGSYHDVKNDTYQVTVPSGIYNSRFQLTFKDEALRTPTTTKAPLFVYQNNKSEMLTISNPNLEYIQSVQLYDLLGKLVLDKHDLGAHELYQFSTTNLSAAVYQVQLVTKDSGKMGQKILITTK